MSLPYPPHAHDEPQAARCHVALIGVGDHARIAERRTLDGVLVGERGSKQQHSRVGELMAGTQPVGEFAGMAAERAYEVAVSALEARDDVVQRPCHVVVGQRKNSLEHQSRSRLLVFEALLARDEELGDHARRVGCDALRATGGECDASSRHCGTDEKRRACCSVESTASVDSAP